MTLYGKSTCHQLVVYTGQFYNAPKGSVGRRFVLTVADLMIGIKERKWNSEWLIVFGLTILQQK